MKKLLKLNNNVIKTLTVHEQKAAVGGGSSLVTGTGFCAGTGA